MGNVYIADSASSRIQKVTLSTGNITTVAGTGTPAYNGDNRAATSAELKYPQGVAIDGSGNVYIGDKGNNRIRLLTSALPTSSPTAAPSVKPTVSSSVVHVSPLCNDDSRPSSAFNSHHCKIPKPTPANNRRSPSSTADIHV